jgi:hypothetical protein
MQQGFWMDGKQLGYTSNGVFDFGMHDFKRMRKLL